VTQICDNHNLYGLWTVQAASTCVFAGVTVLIIPRKYKISTFVVDSRLLQHHDEW